MVLLEKIIDTRATMWFRRIFPWNVFLDFISLYERLSDNFRVIRIIKRIYDEDIRVLSKPRIEKKHSFFFKVRLFQHAQSIPRLVSELVKLHLLSAVSFEFHTPNKNLLWSLLWIKSEHSPFTIRRCCDGEIKSNTRMPPFFLLYSNVVVAWIEHRQKRYYLINYTRKRLLLI